MATVKVYSEYDRPPVAVVDCSNLPSMTRQADKDSCDINIIMRRYEKTGMLPEFANPGWFGDVTGIGDYRDVRDRMNQIGAVFGQLTAEVRAGFDNDPAVFVDFIADPANEGRMVELGLLPAPKEPEAPPAAPPAP